MIEVLYQDEDLIFINKPAGLPSQQTMDVRRPHVISELQKQLPDLKLYLHHRLDKDTSGVMLIGASSRSNKALTDIFREHKIHKEYLALVKKDKALSQDKWIVKNHLAPVRKTNKELMRMVLVKKGGWVAETHFEKLDEKKNFYIIRATPITGRTHQIRAHLACDKRPILGDNLYGGKSTLVPRLMLHAWRLGLNHPITGKELMIEASLPKDMQKIIND